MNKILGIDLGTTYSCVAYVDEFGKAVTVKNCDGDMTTPSVVYFESKDKQFVGIEAKTNAVLEPENTVSFIKREMGTEYRRTIYGEEYSPQEISARILKKIAGDANAVLREQGILKSDEEIKKVVITCPAYFGVAEKEATKSAGILAGLEVLDIINEPTAAAINYGVINEAQSKKNVMVYDLGGGTFDVTIISVEEGNINVICTGGDPMLGGKDWDSVLKDYFVKCWQDEMGTSEDISEDLETLSGLMESAEKAKKTLTTKDTAKVNILHEGERIKVEISRSVYDDLTRGLLERTIDLTDSCLEDARTKGCALADIDEILLVGGSSRMPQVKQIMEEKYQKPTYLFDPDEAVAKGAALYAQNLDMFNITIEEIVKKTKKTAEEVKKQVESGKSLNEIAEKENVNLQFSSGKISGLARMTINNVSSRTYGVDVWDSSKNKTIIQNFIFQNDTLPAKSTHNFYTLKEGQQGVVFNVYESIGSDEIIEDLDTATQITSIKMDFQKPVPEGTEIITTVHLENSGLLYVEAEEMVNHSKLNASYEVKNGLNKEEMSRALARTNNSKVE